MMGGRPPYKEALRFNTLVTSTPDTHPPSIFAHKLTTPLLDGHFPMFPSLANFGDSLEESPVL